jgi:hypothetical protein
VLIKVVRVLRVYMPPRSSSTVENRNPVTSGHFDTLTRRIRQQMLCYNRGELSKVWNNLGTVRI